MDKFSPQQAFAQKLKDVLELIVDSIFHILSAAKASSQGVTYLAVGRAAPC